MKGHYHAVIPRYQRCHGRILGKMARKAPPKKVRNALHLVEGAVQNRLLSTRIKRLRNQNAADHILWRSRKGLVRRQAANTSLRPDQDHQLLYAANADLICLRRHYYV